MYNADQKQKTQPIQKPIIADAKDVKVANDTQLPGFTDSG